jgi:hypothetical protein
MGIAKNHLSYAKFFNNEIKTLGFLQGFSPINSSFQDLYSKSYNLFHQYVGKTNVSFEFESELNLTIEKKERKIVIEAKVTPDFAFSTYVLTMYSDANNEVSKLMRKFHFDFVANTCFEERKPVYHLQYGGSATPTMKKLEIDDSDILPWLSVPRLNSLPVNLALLLDTIFCEFPNEVTMSITERSEWRDHVKNNEQLMLKDYYAKVNEFFQNTHKSNFLYRDFCYGKK